MSLEATLLGSAVLRVVDRKESGVEHAEGWAGTRLEGISKHNIYCGTDSGMSGSLVSLF